MNRQANHTVAVMAIGLCLGAVGHAILSSGQQPANAQSNEAIPDWRAELESLKSKLPDQSHAMQDVGYHFSNLWFAGIHHHWDLANFYWAETRSHLHWAVSIIPVRKDNAGADVNLVEILVAFENGPLKQLGEAIASRDSEKFAATYRASMTACYSCHKASDKPFIRPRIPAHPETPIINFDPNAAWPQ